jgi:hypothetical protein
MNIKTAENTVHPADAPKSKAKHCSKCESREKNPNTKEALKLRKVEALEKANGIQSGLLLATIQNNDFLNRLLRRHSDPNLRRTRNRIDEEKDDDNDPNDFEDDPVYQCTLCNIGTSDMPGLMQHCEGHKHMEVLDRNRWYCYGCGGWSSQSVDAHENGRKHRERSQIREDNDDEHHPRRATNYDYAMANIFADQKQEILDLKEANALLRDMQMRVERRRTMLNKNAACESVKGKK